MKFTALNGQKFELSQKGLDDRGLGSMYRLDSSLQTLTLFDNPEGGGRVSLLPRFDDQAQVSNWLNKNFVYDEKNDAAFFKRVSDSVRIDMNPDFRPTPADMEIIGGMMKCAMSADQLKVFNTYSADMLMTSKSHHFAETALADMASLTPFNPVMDAHDWWNPGGVFGKLFEGSVASSTEAGKYLFQRFFMLDDPEYRSIIRGFQSGINDKLSVGIMIDLGFFRCDLCKKAWTDGCEHWPGDIYLDAKGKQVIATFTIERVKKFKELSRVALPAAAMAHVINPMAVQQSIVTQSDIGQKPAVANISDRLTDKEDAIVENGTETKPAEQEVQTNSAAEAPAFDAVVKQMSDEISKLVAAAVSKEVAEASKPLKEVNEKLSATLQTMAKALDDRNESVDRSLQENREALKNCIELHQKLAEKLDFGSAKSVEELKRWVNSLSAKEAGASTPQPMKQADNGGLFSSLMQQLHASAVKKVEEPASK